MKSFAWSHPAGKSRAGLPLGNECPVLEWMLNAVLGERLRPFPTPCLGQGSFFLYCQSSQALKTPGSPAKGHPDICHHQLCKEFN